MQWHVVWLTYAYLSVEPAAPTISDVRKVVITSYTMLCEPWITYIVFLFSAKIYTEAKSYKSNIRSVRFLYNTRGKLQNEEWSSYM